MISNRSSTCLARSSLAALIIQGSGSYDRVLEYELAEDNAGRELRDSPARDAPAQTQQLEVVAVAAERCLFGWQVPPFATEPRQTMMNCCPNPAFQAGRREGQETGLYADEVETRQSRPSPRRQTFLESCVSAEHCRTDGKCPCHCRSDR
jgi:hypothetical protein